MTFRTHLHSAVSCFAGSLYCIPASITPSAGNPVVVRSGLPIVFFLAFLMG
mgnify:FL=1